MAQKPVPKHLTITIDFDLQTEGSTVHYKRAHTAYEAAVTAAISEATRVLPSDSIKAITSEIDWSYRWQRAPDVHFTRLNADDTTHSDAEEEERQWDDDGLFFDIESGRWMRSVTVQGGDVEVVELDD
ncbi:hypothetical protein SZN_34462 [Streptomyces zinciresistens K42]|uniref:Uncharacterized protein n=1 Tax=Streptomyces zinciresistens K42 TaxID=700597 RepID=G2GMY7_9ACTN|nr:hypothetical protein [Streptomyces zinciresistens]EGX55130.1 hypothetical protein SZN_34462 [Streptomyces zinciresistens K42]